MLPLAFRLRRAGMLPLWFLRNRYPSPVRLTSRANSSVHTPRLRYGLIFSHLLAGVAGGGIVLGSGYAYYHFSGMKRAVDAAKQVKEYLTQTRESILRKHPNEAVEYLRKVAKTYVVFVPGSGYLIDRFFNSVEDIVDEHREEASEILIRAQVEIQEIMKHKSELNNVELASRIMKVVGDHLSQIGALGSKLAPAWVHIPDMTVPHEKVVESVGSLKGLAGKVWPKSNGDKDKESEPYKK